eukprot:CAMPEP_0168180884 /NCGR_PEP_ID=MMETSP0139_2-20121125/10835_1 /TAXON_ID=44445 /ORGANISM="Pseudo-nitzschia australis, Strain 10249 10 AB" /LENGTH=320 /DNA_ID=CAMNT_0008101251 /DNA_START=68 /DNA_END=1030 /DNA_ORIENTATION=+
MQAAIVLGKSLRRKCWLDQRRIDARTHRRFTSTAARTTTTLLGSSSLSLSVSCIVGDIAITRADAITVSSNPSLTGNLQPNYWRFSGRTNTNGAVRKKGGTDLDFHCEQVLENSVKITNRDQRRDAPHLLPVGEAVTTPAGKNLPNAKHVIHVVVPDRITHYDGNEDCVSASCVGDAQTTTSGYDCADDKDADTNAGIDILIVQLRMSYASVLECAEKDAGAERLAIPALGCGIKGWNHRVSARVAGEAIQKYFCGGKAKANIEMRQQQQQHRQQQQNHCGKSDGYNHENRLPKHIVFVLKSKPVRDVWEEELKKLCIGV